MTPQISNQIDATGGGKPKYWGAQMVVVTDDSIGVSQLLEVHVLAAYPKVYAYG